MRYLQLEAKTRKLKKVWHKLQGAQQEIRDLAEEFQKEREDMLDTIRELHKQVKLKQLLLDSFVPAEEIERVCVDRATDARIQDSAIDNGR